MGRQFKIKRKDGKGWWTLPHMEQAQINALVGGEDTDLHKHDQRYYTETELDRDLDFFNGTFIESFDALVTSDGATVTMSIEQSGTGNLTMSFSSGRSTLDCTPAATIELTAGTDPGPQANYVYVLESTGVLTKDTSGWPSAEHIRVAYFLVPSAGFVQTDGTYINQNWNDHRKSSDDQGHLAHLCEAIRLTMDGARWHEGVTPNGDGGTYIVTTGSPDEVYFKATSGVAFQMHKHTLPAINMQTGDMCHVINWNGDAYHVVTDLASIVADSTGTTLNNRYYNLTFWGTANKSGEHSPLMCNLPTGSYALLQDAVSDANGYDVTAIPYEFTKESTIGFLICRLTFRLLAGTTFTLENTVDLRGVSAGASSGAGGAEGFITEFADNVFTIYDSDDISRIIDFDLAGITTGNTRIITPADADMKILTAVNHDDLTDGGETTLHSHSGTAWLRHDGTIELSDNWDVGAAHILYIDTIRSRLATDTGLTLANRGGTAYIYIDDGSFNVGINMIPGKPLDVYSPTTTPVIRAEIGEAANCFIECRDKDTSFGSQVYLGAIGDDMVIFGHGTSAIRIIASGVLDVANSACVLDEDDLNTDSATQLATQQSIKKYVDDAIAAAPPAVAPGMVARGKFTYKDADEIYIGAAAYHHAGTADQMVYWDAQLTKTVGSTAGWQYLYLDDSAIVTLGDNELTATELIFSTTVPTWSHTKHGWYNSNDRCIFATYNTSTSVQREFFSTGGGYVHWADDWAILASTDIDTTWIDVTCYPPTPGGTVQLTITNEVNTVQNAITKWYIRVDGQSGATGNIVLISQFHTSFVPNLGDNSIMIPTSVAANKIEVKTDFAGAAQVAIKQTGWYFPEGM